MILRKICYGVIAGHSEYGGSYLVLRVERVGLIRLVEGIEAICGKDTIVAVRVISNYDAVRAYLGA